MTRLTILLCCIAAFLCADAEKFSYRFNSTPLSEALSKIAEDHPDAKINFIYNELEDYRTSATVDADDPYSALRQAIGINPVTVVRDGNALYCEAMQHGRFHITGRAMGTDSRPVSAATVMVLNPKDSTVLTYGITKSDGYFSIPCDQKNVLLKLTSVGYEPTFHSSGKNDVGTIFMKQQSVRLKEIKVEAKDALMYVDKSVYIPNKKQKKLAADGNMLLFSMAIPEVRVSLLDGRVTTQAGEGYNFYIDYLKASPDAMQNLKASDVLKVEVYEKPEDPRFQGDRNVINFILVKYEYGGYAKLTANEYFGKDGGAYSAYVKGAYKKMTFEAGGNAGWSGNRHNRTESEQTYRFPEQTVHVSSEKRDSINKNHYGSGFFRAIYDSDKSNISNIIGFSASRVPDNISLSSELFSSPDYESGKSMSLSSGRINSVTWNGEYLFALPKDFYLTVTPSASYSESRNDFEYLIRGVNVTNDTKEKAWSAVACGRLFKRLSKHSATLQLYGSASGNDMHYFGSSPYAADGRTYYTSIFGEANLNFGKFFIMPSFRFGYQREDLTGIKRDSFDPHFFMFASWMIRKNSRLQFSTELSKMFVPLSSLSPTVQYSNQIAGYMGNPDLKTSVLESMGLTWSWSPSSSVYVSPFLQFQRYGKMYDYEFIPKEFDGRQYMISHYVNSGHISTFLYGAQGGISLLNRALSIQAGFNGSYYDINGTMKYRKNDFSGYLQLYYMFRNLYAMGAVSTSSMSATQYGVTHSPAHESLSMGWSNGNWNISAQVNYPFESFYRKKKTNYNSDRYSSSRFIYSVDCHRCFRISATYTFSYGKKLQQGNESQTPQSTTRSGILQ